MKYISTRGEINPVSFREAVMMGLARDGGLLIPENIPDVSDRLNDWKEMSFIDLGTRGRMTSLHYAPILASVAE